MEISNIPEAFSLSIRLKLISSLLNGEKTFTDLKKITKATDGNISVQLTKLEEWGYIESTKAICGKRPKASRRKNFFRFYKKYVLRLAK